MRAALSNPTLAGLALCAVAGAAGCKPPIAPRDDRMPSTDPLPSATVTPPPRRVVSDELEPGTVRAFGVLMPVGTVERFHNDDSHVLYLPHPMPRVMRYLQRRLEIINADIYPLGAMIRDARVLTGPTGPSATRVDVAVRDENSEGTQVSLWLRRHNQRVYPTRSDALRAAGFDPTTGRPLPGNND